MNKYTTVFSTAGQNLYESRLRRVEESKERQQRNTTKIKIRRHRLKLALEMLKAGGKMHTICEALHLSPSTIQRAKTLEGSPDGKPSD